METEMTYWRHRTPVGVKVEEIGGGEDKSRRLWEILARQVYNENGKDGAYRVIGHYPDGAPCLEGSQQRISLSHTGRLMVVATLPPTPEVDLAVYSPRAAMGIDTERLDRKVSDEVVRRVLTSREMELAEAAGAIGRVLAWTCKEALYKAARGIGESWQEDYRILRLPDPHSGRLGEGEIVVEGEAGPCILCSWISEEYLLTIALSRHCATFRKELPED